MMELRCDNKLHGEVVSDEAAGEFEVKCTSRYCGAGKGKVVLHRFNLETGQMVSTQRFKAPPNRKAMRNASHHNSAAVRSA